MKILHILSSNKFSGAENVALTIIKTMRNSNECIYCSPSGPINEILEKENILFVEIKKLDRKNLVKVIKENKPDVIHAHDIKASVLAASIRFKGKVISHIHKNDPKMKKLSIKSFVYKLLSKKMDKIVGVSDAVIDEFIFKKSIIDKYMTISNFVNREEIINKSKQFEVTKKYDLFYVGRLSEEKGCLDFIDICRKLREVKDYKAVMIGDGPLKEACLEKIKNYNLESNIELVGFQSNPFPYIAASKVGIMPSKFEGFGLTAIESMLLGKAVLNSGVGGLKKVFEGNEHMICSSIEEYTNKVFEDVCINTENIYKYSNVEIWESNLKEIYKF